MYATITPLFGLLGLGTQEIMLAIERGELDGIAGYSYRTPPDVVTRAQAIVAAN